MQEEKDPRFRRLSTLGAVLNFVAVVFALTATVSYHWAELSGPIRGYMGPFIVCQDIPSLHDRCERGGLGPYRQSWASYVAGTGAVLCTIFLAVGSILGPLVVAMHFVHHALCVKFRHAVFVRVIVNSGAAMTSLIALICFVLEAKVFFKMQSNNSADLSWSFYIEGLAFVLSCVVGVIASVEWKWSRKLGGDPTVYTRDPEGTKSETIANPNFREGPRTGPNGGPPKGGPNPGANKLHRNANGVAMTHVSGLPYSVVINGNKKRGSSGGGVGMNGHAVNGKGRSRMIVAFDPKRTPIRSSMKRPKNPPPSAEDALDSAVTSGVVQNPSFAPASPTMKKKVRIFTVSTAV